MCEVITEKSELVEVFLSHRPQMRACAQKIVGCMDVAEDVVQDAYMRLVEGMLASEVAKPLSYCYQVVRNLALDHHRRRGVEGVHRVFSDDGELPEVVGGVSPDRVIHERRLLHAIDEVLQTLPARTRHAFELFRIGGLTQREIARQLDCSATLVNFMVKDAMTALTGCRALLDG